MGFHQSQSLLYLEARCLCLQRAMGVQGTQNGGIDGAPVTMTMPGRRPRADGREPDRRLARPRMRLRQRRPTDRIRDPRRRQDHALPHRRLRPDLLRLRLDPEVRQLLQPLAPERRGARGLPRPPARLRGRRRPDARSARTGRWRCAPRALDAIAAVLEELGPRRARRAAMLASVATASGSNDTESFTAGRRRPHQRGDPRPRHHRHRRRSGRWPPAASARRPRTCSRSSACGSPATTCRPRR